MKDRNIASHPLEAHIECAMSSIKRGFGFDGQQREWRHMIRKIIDAGWMIFLISYDGLIG